MSDRFGPAAGNPASWPFDRARKIDCLQITGGPVFDPLIRKLERFTRLEDDDRRSIRSLPFTLRSFQRNDYVFRDGDPARHCYLVIDGVACGRKITNEGARQITSLCITGDIINPHNLYMGTVDFSACPLGQVTVAAIQSDKLNEIARNRPNVSLALWLNSLADASVSREWLLSLGRRNAMEGIAHFFCELAIRSEIAGISNRDSFEMPLTLSEIGDVTGLTPVHVSRTLTLLRTMDVISKIDSKFRISHWSRLSKIALFNEDYLFQYDDLRG